MTCKHLIDLALCAFVAASCGGNEREARGAGAPPRASGSPPSVPARSVAQPRDDAVKVKSADGTHVIEFAASGGDIKIEIDDGGRTSRLVGALKGSGKREYAPLRGAAVAEVKSDAAGFKLRTAQGALLWKVKLDDDKIKVSDNDENHSAWVLKTKYQDKVKIVDPSEVEIGEVKFYRDRGAAKVKDMAGAELFDSHTTRYSAAYGVLLMKGVPAELRPIIMAEILIRGR